LTDARFFASPGEWRAWLEEHHDSADEVVVGYWRRGTGRPSLTWAQSVDEALCFGWIDGVRRRIDDERYCIRFTPRQARSRWSRVNVERVAELARAGRMRPAGLAAFEARTEEGTYSYEQQREAALDAEREARLRGDDAAWEFFAAQPPWYRRAAVHWVMSAKREETRDRRLAQLVACSADGRPVPPLTRPA
jgi:uncharacterized protein YdeI (YjbR/CyaY-like superfamily)